jgi:hypothetical protein
VTLDNFSVVSDTCEPQPLQCPDGVPPDKWEQTPATVQRALVDLYAEYELKQRQLAEVLAALDGPPPMEGTR